MKTVTIENYDEKAKALIENGWETLYHLDNWIKTEWRDKDINTDWSGRSTDQAYKTLKIETN